MTPETDGHAAVAAAQGRLDDARVAVRSREEEVQAARAALPPPLDLIMQDPPLAAALAPTPEDEDRDARITELQTLIWEAKAAWNREGIRVVESQRSGASDMAVLDEDERFLAATEILEALMVEQNELRRGRDLDMAIRLYKASVKRHDDALDERQAMLHAPTPEARGLRAEISRRLKDGRRANAPDRDLGADMRGQ